MTSVGKQAWGPQYNHVRQLFTAVVAARTDYGASIWHRPKDKKSQAAAQTQKLTTIQRLAMKAICGCYRTTSTAAMSLETELPSPRLRLQQKILKTATRMQTLSANNPVTIWMTLAQRTNEGTHQRFPSNLKNLVGKFPKYFDKTMETIEPCVKPPWWESPIDTVILRSKEEAQKEAL